MIVSGTRRRCRCRVSILGPRSFYRERRELR
jgi:hypothetical protein